MRTGARPWRTPHGVARRGALAGLVAIAVLGAAACTSSDDDPTSSASASRPSASTSSSAEPSGEGAPQSGPSDPDAEPAEGGGSLSEGLPDPTPAPSGPALPEVVVLTGPMPASASAKGELVAGFPSAIVPVVDGVTVVSSSVSSQGDRLQLGLQGSSPLSPEELTARYTEAMAARGFQPSSAAALEGSTATQFRRGSDGVVLTVRARVGGGTELSLAGTLVKGG